MMPMRRIACAVVVMLGTSCGETGPQEATAPTYAQGVTGAGGSVPTVASTSPAAAQQDTTLDVQVFGTGYDRGSRADFVLHATGTLDPRVATNSTRYVSATQLVANITIALDAVVSSYDVVVTTSTGKKGIGSELFTVDPADPSAIFEFTDTGMQLTSDSRGPYAERLCGVYTRIFVGTSGSGSGDAVLYPYKKTGTGTSSPCGTPRALNVYLGPDFGTRTIFFLNVNQVNQLIGGSSRVQDLGMTLNDSHLQCERLRYNAEVGGPGYGIIVTATGVDALGRRTWTAASQAPHYAGCYNLRSNVFRWDGIRRVIQFQVKITEVLAP